MGIKNTRFLHIAGNGTFKNKSNRRMTTISLKIKKEDKPAMAIVAERCFADYVPECIELAIIKEAFMEVSAKLRASSHSDAPMRFTLMQVMALKKILEIYSEIGSYELANSLYLSEQIKKKEAKALEKIG
jgi:trimethylamine:corrinoid methyltransferase-like protein